MATETELKYLLSATGFQRLVEALGRPARVAQQHNVYFDTPQKSLARRRMAVRIRTVGSTRTLTVKRSAKSGSQLGLSVREEYECRLTPKAAELIRSKPSSAQLHRLAPWRKLLEGIDEKRVGMLKQTASMHTKRSVYPMARGVVLELDEVTLASGSKFYEVELECHNAVRARRFLTQVFSQAGVRARPVRRTKLARVMRELRK